MILAALAEGQVLETGVGTSRNSRYYLKDVEVTAVDWSLPMLEMALLNVGDAKIHFKQEDVENMSFKDDSFDTVVDTFGLEYYLNPEKVLKEMRRVCRPNGRILLLAAGQSSYPWLNFLSEFWRHKTLKTYGYFSLRDWDRIVAAEAFEVERAERVINGSLYIFILRNNKPEKAKNSQDCKKRWFKWFF
jgi:ubiquinone/menaquinone biosynthesis C-methylase UbiE